MTGRRCFHRLLDRRLLWPVAGCAALLVLGAGGPAMAAATDPSLPPAPVLPAATAPSAPAPAHTEATAGGTSLQGVFKITAGSCSGAITGSYFRMIQPNGTAAAGPFVQNTDSGCGDKTFTAMAPGTDGGLTTGGYQPEPDPAFDSTGGGKAGRITAPTKFYGVNFATATNPTDPQTGTKVAAPAITVDSGGKLHGDLRAFAASWNNQHFNQGAPKPDGSTPGTTAGPSGTYDAATGAFVLEWTSQIVGGPFNNFTGEWHLEGRFASSAPAPTSSTTGTTAAAGSSPNGGRVAAASAAPSSPTRAAASPTAADTAAPALPHTGPRFPALWGLLAAVAALVSVSLRRRVRRS